MRHQLDYLQDTVLKALWEHKYAGPFQQPVDPVELKIPVSYNTNVQDCCLKLRWYNIFPAKQDVTCWVKLGAIFSI